MTSIFKRRGSGCCVAVGCSMRKATNLLSQVKLFKFPRNPERRRQWELAVRRDNWKATNSSQLCNLHFVSGRPSRDPSHPDYVPSVFNFKNETTSVACYEKHAKRLKTGASHSKAGANGLKRRKLKRNAIPSLSLPTTPEYTDESETNVKLKKTKKSTTSRETPTSKDTAEEERELICLDETDSHESARNQEEVRKNSSLNSIVEVNEEWVDVDKFLNASQICITTPNNSDITVYTVENSKEHTQKWTSLIDGKIKEKPKFDCQVLKATPNNSRRILKRKLKTELSVNAMLLKKVKFYQNKCKMYEKELNILKGVIDNLKLINSAIFDNYNDNLVEHSYSAHTAEQTSESSTDKERCITSSSGKNKGKSDFDCSMFTPSTNDSEDILKRKLKTVLSVNEDLLEKIKSHQRKLKMCKKEINIMNGVIDNLKLINSVTFDN